MGQSRAVAYYVSLLNAIAPDDDGTERRIILRQVVDGPAVPYAVLVFITGGALAGATAYYTALAQMRMLALGMLALAIRCVWAAVNQTVEYFAARRIALDKRVELIHLLLAKKLITLGESERLVRVLENSAK